MKTLQNYSLEVLLLITTAWMGILAFIYETFGMPLTTHENTVLLEIFHSPTAVFTPSVIMSDYNHIMLVVAPLLTVIGLYGLFKPDSNARKGFMFFEMAFWFFQVIGLIALGFYPLAASFASLFFGVAFYLVLIKFWK